MAEFRIRQKHTKNSCPPCPSTPAPSCGCEGGGPGEFFGGLAVIAIMGIVVWLIICALTGR